MCPSRTVCFPEASDSCESLTDRWSFRGSNPTVLYFRFFRLWLNVVRLKSDLWYRTTFILRLKRRVFLSLFCLSVPNCTAPIDPDGESGTVSGSLDDKRLSSEKHLVPGVFR